MQCRSARSRRRCRTRPPIADRKTTTACGDSSTSNWPASSDVQASSSGTGAMNRSHRRRESGWARSSRLDDLDVQVQVGRVLVCHARDACDEAAVDARPELERGAVRADDDGIAGRDRPSGRVLGRELELGRRTLEGELADALDERAGEERSIAEEAELAEEVPVCGPRRCNGLDLGSRCRRLVRRPCGEGSRAVQLRAVDAAEDAAQRARRRRRPRGARARRRTDRRAARARPARRERER